MRRRADEALRASEARYRSLFAHSMDAILLTAPDGRVLAANAAACRMFGRTEAEMLEAGRSGLVDASDPRLADLLALREATGSARGELRMLRRDGSSFPAEVSSAAFIDADGEPRTSMIIRDISERRRAEEAILTVRRLLEQTFASLNEAVFIVDTDTRQVVDCNPAVERIFGYRKEEVVGRNTAFLHGSQDHYERFGQRLFPALDAAGVFHCEFEMLSKDGIVFPTEHTVTEIRDDAGRRAQVVSVVRDITERRRLEATRAEAVARLAAVQEEERRRLSRELHDQTAQRLAAMALELRDLEAGLTAGRPQHERVRSLRRAADDLQQQVRDLAWELRAVEPTTEGLACALQEYVEDWSDRARMPAEFACRDDAGSRLPILLESTLYRVAQEALANVQRHARARRVWVLLERDATTAQLTVGDDGCGFDPEAVDRNAADTRRLGLSGMRDRVTLAGGTFLIESSPGAGTKILARLPVPVEAGPR